MATESKKYKRDILKRAIALIICLLCISGMTSRLLTSLYKTQEQGLVAVNFTDALKYDILGIEKNEWDYTSFRNGYTRLLSLLDTKVREFGNASKEDYKKREKEYSERLKAETDFYKDRVIYVASTYATSFADLYDYGIIEVAEVYLTEETGDGITYIDYTEEFDYTDYRYLEGKVKEPVLPLSVADKFADKEYDNVFHNTATVTVCNDEGEPRVRYLPGYYAFRVNSDLLRQELISSGAVNSFYSSYEAFYNDYLQLERELTLHAGTARYFIRSKGGETITNIKALGEKSSSEDVKTYFDIFDTYSYSKDGTIYLNDGRYYSDTYLDWFDNGQYYITEDEAYHTAVQTTMPPVEENVSYTDQHGDEVTVFETTMVVTYRPQEQSIPETELYIAFDKNAEYESCHFAQVRSNVEKAEEHIRDCLFTFGILGTVLLICVICLIAVTGKRKGSKEIRLYSADKIFPEIRILLDGGLGFGSFLLAYYFLKLYLDSELRSLMGIFTVFFVFTLFLACLDLILYLTRHIKNRSLLKNTIMVRLSLWLIKSVKRIKAYADKKLLYTKKLRKTVFIRTALVIGINIFVGFFAFGFGTNGNVDLSLAIIVILFLFDLFVVYRGLRFVAGTDKLFSLVEEMHKGNTDIEIDKNALPDYLYLPAENLQGLSRGIRAAVNEAVKQEKTKTELITNVSHDLKTPLTSIINYVDLLKKCDIDDEEALSYIQVLSEKSGRLKALIEDLVEASKASAGAINVELVCVSCKELAGQLLGEFEEAFGERGLEVITSLPQEDVIIRADSKQLYRVMENLFVNIKKYAMENTRVYLTVSEKNGRGAINLKNISSAPLNISAEELKERFVRGEQSRTTEGNGLGLSIAENLCILQGGSLDIEIMGDLFSVTVEMEKE